MPKANRICKHCGKEYYVCYSCVNINSYKRLFCSAQCFKDSLKKTQQAEEKANKKKAKKEELQETTFFAPSDETFI